MTEQHFKKAALLLKVLSDEDRQWMIGNLKQDENIVLEPVLERLDQLDNILIADNVQQVLPHILQAENFENSLHSIIIVDGMALKRIQYALQQEPNWVTSAILDFYDWSWKAAYLKSLDLRSRRSLLQKNNDNHQLSYKVKHALVEGLALHTQNAN